MGFGNYRVLNHTSRTSRKKEDEDENSEPKTNKYQRSTTRRPRHRNLIRMDSSLNPYFPIQDDPHTRFRFIWLCRPFSDLWVQPTIGCLRPFIVTGIVIVTISIFLTGFAADLRKFVGDSLVQKPYQIRATNPDLVGKIVFNGGGNCYMTEYTANKKRKGEDLKEGILQLGGLKEKEIESEEEEMKKIEGVKELDNHGKCCNEQLTGTMKEKSIMDPQISFRELHMEGSNSLLGILDHSHPRKPGGRPVDSPTKGVGGNCKFINTEKHGVVAKASICLYERAL